MRTENPEPEIHVKITPRTIESLKSQGIPVNGQPIHKYVTDELDRLGARPYGVWGNGEITATLSPDQKAQLEKKCNYIASMVLDNRRGLLYQ